MATLSELATLDYAALGEPFFNASASAAVALNTLDYAALGEPFYGSESAAPGAPDTALSAEFTIDLTTTAPLYTQIWMDAEFTVELTVADTFVNLGSTAKMEIVF